MQDRIIVGIADLNAIKTSGSISTLGLGSCVGIAMYDHLNKVAGLAHIMLPDSTKIQNNTNQAKFADTAIICLLKKMISIGARRDIIKARIVGGSQMFAMSSIDPNMKIGDRNVESSNLWLRKFGIPIIGQDTGGNYGRSIELFCADGKLVIKTIGHGEKTI